MKQGLRAAGHRVGGGSAPLRCSGTGDRVTHGLSMQGPVGCVRRGFTLPSGSLYDSGPDASMDRVLDACENMRTRCGWAGSDPIYVAYHDGEWGVPEHDDRRLFEFLILEGAQAGLSWLTILKKRENYRRAFEGFDPKRVARFDRKKVAALLTDPGIVRNRRKIAAAIQNARAYLEVRREFGSFDAYIWQFVGGRPRNNGWRTLGEIPATTPEADAMSADLKRRGFAFVGPTICYAFMQATGMVNDHLVSCFRYGPLRRPGGPAV